MERLGNEKPRGLNANALRTWGMLFVVAGVISRGVLQGRILGIGDVTGAQLLDAMRNSYTMAIATAALILQALETCAVPIFAFFLVEGFSYTKSGRMYLLRVVGLALLSEIPFDLAMSGKMLNLSSQNPVFGLVLGLTMLYFFRRYQEKGLKNTLIKACVLIAAILWAQMLRVDHGAAMLVILTVLWALRKKPQLRFLMGATAAVACGIFSTFFMASPMGFLPLHLYNGDRATENRPVNYLAYPVILLVIGLAAQFLL